MGDAEAFAADEVLAELFGDKQLALEEAFVAFDTDVAAGEASLDESLQGCEEHAEECFQQGKACQTEVGRAAEGRIDVESIAEHPQEEFAVAFGVGGSASGDFPREFRKDFDLRAVGEGDDADMVAGFDDVAQAAVVGKGKEWGARVFFVAG